MPGEFVPRIHFPPLLSSLLTTFCPFLPVWQVCLGFASCSLWTASQPLFSFRHVFLQIPTGSSSPMIGPSPYSLFPAHQFKAIFNLLRAHQLFPDVCAGKRQLFWVPGGQQGLPWALGAGAGLCSLSVSVQDPGPAMVPTPVTETLWCGLRLGTFRLWSQGRPGLTGLGGGSLARCSGQECSLPRTLTPQEPESYLPQHKNLSGVSGHLPSIFWGR